MSGQVDGKIEVAAAAILAPPFSLEAQLRTRESSGRYFYFEPFVSLPPIDGDCYPSAVLGVLRRQGKIIGEILRSNSDLWGPIWECFLVSQQKATDFLPQPLQQPKGLELRPVLRLYT